MSIRNIIKRTKTDEGGKGFIELDMSHPDPKFSKALPKIGVTIVDGIKQYITPGHHMKLQVNGQEIKVPNLHTDLNEAISEAIKWFRCAGWRTSQEFC